MGVKKVEIKSVTLLAQLGDRRGQGGGNGNGSGADTGDFDLVALGNRSGGIIDNGIGGLGRIARKDDRCGSAAGCENDFVEGIAEGIERNGQVLVVVLGVESVLS